MKMSNYEIVKKCINHVCDESGEFNFYLDTNSPIYDEQYVFTWNYQELYRTHKSNTVEDKITGKYYMGIPEPQSIMTERQRAIYFVAFVSTIDE